MNKYITNYIIKIMTGTINFDWVDNLLRLQYYAPMFLQEGDSWFLLTSQDRDIILHTTFVYDRTLLDKNKIDSCYERDYLLP